jgi:hypothetical protein
MIRPLPILALLLFGCSERPLDALGNRGSDAGTEKMNCQTLDEKSCVAAAPTCQADYCSPCSCEPQSFSGCRGPNDPAHACPDSGCDCPLCEGLSESSCIDAETTAGCTPSYCPDCKGGRVFSECLRPNAEAPHCFACAGCRDWNDCQATYECLAPGEFPGCGPCDPTPGCSSDVDCAAGQVCEKEGCLCVQNMTGMICIPSCAKAGCPNGQTCGESGHCAPTLCDATTPCPKLFDCLMPLDSREGTCARHSCTQDSDCSGGFCVDGACYQMLGTCVPIPA